MNTPHKNRRQAQKPKLKGGYCGCDSWVGPKGTKCVVCGDESKRTRRMKKLAPTIEEFDPYENDSLKS